MSPPRKKKKIPSHHLFLLSPSTICHTTLDGNSAESHQEPPASTTSPFSPPSGSNGILQSIALGIGHYCSVRSDGSVEATGLLGQGGLVGEQGEEQGEGGTITQDNELGKVDDVLGKVDDVHGNVDDADGLVDCRAVERLPSIAAARQVDAIAHQSVVQCAAGDEHTLVLTAGPGNARGGGGVVYSWGANQAGQAGQGETAGRAKVRRMRSLAVEAWSDERRARERATGGGDAAVAVSAGARHSVLLAGEGGLLVAGDNSHGQLGLGDREARTYLTSCAASRLIPVAEIACGDRHTVVLSLFGVVYGAGASDSGQLGNGKGPPVPELRVSSGASGRRLVSLRAGKGTTIGVTAEGTLVRFGVNGCAPIEVPADADSMLRPRFVDAIPDGPSGCLAVRDEGRRLVPVGDGPLGRRLSASGLWLAGVQSLVRSVSTAQALVAVSSDCAVENDSRWRTESSHAASVRRDTLAAHGTPLATASSVDLDDPLAVEAFLRSGARVNASFVLDGDARLGDLPALDDDALASFWSELHRRASSNQTLWNAVSRACLALAESLRQVRLLPSDELCRAFLVLAASPFLRPVRSAAAVVERFVTALLGIPAAQRRTVLGWLAARPSPRTTVDLLREWADYAVAEGLQTQLVAAVSLLDQFRVRLEASECPLPPDAVHLDAAIVHSRYPLRSDYTRWLERPGGSFSLLDTPALLSPSTKRLVLVECQRRRAAAESRAALGRAFFAGSEELPVCLLRVRRSRLAGSALDAVADAEARGDLRKPLRVQFVGEDGVDEGGVAREFFHLLCAELFDPKYGLFYPAGERGEYLWFSPDVPEDTLPRLHLLGVVMALALVNDVQIPVPLAPAVFQLLLGRPPTLDALETVDHSVASSLRALLAATGDIERDFCLTFSVATQTPLGVTHTKDLVADGENVPVTDRNRDTFVNLYLRWLLRDLVAPAAAAFRSGFAAAADGPVLDLLTPLDLEQLLLGERHVINLLKDLRPRTVYVGWEESHPTVQHFWSVVSSFTDSQASAFLNFIRGSDRLPAGGPAALPPFTLQRAGSAETVELLPTASTCFFTLLLPPYDSLELCRERLTKAIEYCAGFALQ
eukprot:CAMPEP_0170737446 /NCGR_PEP_ID=MMETSP0437-20130122/4129_1 /TAXON_ID=0 /ORGANISM="Sexangularia sp." /LENGTH=1095 /DNA_ID=CAMNT_0011075829 /DNA_START=68 /DNA_END=3355 /DNA_ORIENTATION=-